MSNYEPHAQDPELEAKLSEAHALLSEIYDPAGVLLFWSARIAYLDGKRPCDLARDRDYAALETLCARLEAIADGAFL